MRGALRRLDNERGSVSVTAMAAIAIALLLCLLLCEIGFFLAARHKAHNAADAAALCAVQKAFPLFSDGEDPTAAARRLAGENGAGLESITISEGGDRVEVCVRVVRPSVLSLAGAGEREVSARAAAEVDLDALVASGCLFSAIDPTTLGRLRSILASLGAHQRGGLSAMVVILALCQLGKPYVYGAEGPNTFDCSGLVQFVYAQVGIRLPRVATDQAYAGRAVSRSELQPGDLVLFRRNCHIGIYLGGGYFVHAPRTGDVVKISELGSRSDISACRRII